MTSGIELEFRTLATKWKWEVCMCVTSSHEEIHNSLKNANVSEKLRIENKTTSYFPLTSRIDGSHPRVLIASEGKKNFLFEYISENVMR